MRTLFYRVLNVVRYIVGAMPKRRLSSPVLYRVVHYTLVVLITVLLAAFSDRITAPSELDLPYWWLRRFWWGILAILFYLFVRLLVYLIGLLLARDEPEFADIEYAWNAGIAALQRQGLDMRWLPTILVNGLTPAQERNLFDGSRMSWKVVAPPPDERSVVLRFFASDDGLFISCTGVGATSMQLSQGRSLAAVSASNPNATMSRPGGSATLRREDLAAAARPTEGELFASRPGRLRRRCCRRRIRVASLRRRVRPLKWWPIPSTITSWRWPSGGWATCAICCRRTASRIRAMNGMIQAVPLSWSSNQRELAKLCPAAAHDVEGVVECLELQFPMVLLVTDLDQLSGFEEFLERCGKLDGRFRHSRAGSRFPAGATIDEKHSAWAVERGLHWFRGWTYSSLASDLGNTAGNRKLFRLLCDLSDRRGRLEFLLKKCFAFKRQPSDAVRLSGFYFSATGEGSAPGVHSRGAPEGPGRTERSRLERAPSAAGPLGPTLGMAAVSAGWYSAGRWGLRRLEVVPGEVGS